MKFLQSFAPFILLIFAMSACSEERESYTVNAETIVESVYSSIVVDPAEMYKVNSTVAGYIDAVNFNKGDHIHAGDILFQIRDVPGDRSTSNAQLAYQLAQKNYLGDQSALDDLKLEMDNARLKKRNDSINYQRNLALYKESVLSKVELEQSELIFTNSKNALASLSNRYKRLERELRLSVEQARNNYQSSVSRTSDALITSLIDGIVYDITKEPGELVLMQESVAIIGSSDDFTLKMLIDEVDITRVQPGQKIIVSLEAYKNEVFEAEVIRISPKMDTRTQTFEIEGKFIKAPKKLYMGLTGEGNIVTNTRENVLVIPLEYLVDGEKVETDRGQVRVKVGIRSLSHAEILSGLKKGDVIYKPEQ